MARTLPLEGAKESGQIGWSRDWPERADEEDGEGLDATAQAVQNHERSWIGPLEILHGQGHWGLGAQILQKHEHRFCDPEFRLGRQGEQGLSWIGAGLPDEHLGDRRPALVRGTAVELEGIGQDPEGSAPLQFLTSGAEYREAEVLCLGDGLVDDPGLADPRLPLDEEDAPQSAGSFVEEVGDAGHLHLSPDQRR